jgi:serine protease Do
VSDVVLKFDGKTVSSADDLVRLVGTSKPGAKVTLEVLRNKASKQLHLVIGEMPDERTAQRPAGRGKPAAEAPVKLGMTLAELSAEQRKELKVSGGILVEDAQGTAARAGIRRGDVILAVNNQNVKNIDEFNKAIAQFEKGRSVALLVRRGTGALYIGLRIE